MFPSRDQLQGLSEAVTREPLRSEKDLETYHRIAIDNQVDTIVNRLCKIPGFNQHFGSQITQVRGVMDWMGMMMMKIYQELGTLSPIGTIMSESGKMITVTTTMILSRLLN